MLSQLSFKHGFNRLRKKSGEDTLFAKEVINGLGGAQLLLNLFEGGKVWLSLLCLCFLGCVHGLPSSFPLLSSWKFYFIGGNPVTQIILHSQKLCSLTDKLN